MTRTRVLLAASAMVAMAGCPGSSSPRMDVTGAEEVDAAAGELPPMQDGWNCRPGDTKCMGSNFLVCNQDGSDWDSTACGAGATCTTSGCSGWTCRPGDAKCMGSNFLVCKQDGSDWVSSNCGAGTTCTASGCAVVTGDVIVLVDVTVTPDAPVDGVTPPQDVVTPVDTTPPQDTTVPPVDVVTPVDTIVTDPGQPPQDTIVPPVDVLDVVVTDTAPQGCQADQDCTNGQHCCQTGMPGSPKQCRNSCSPLGNLPTCSTDTDCTGGQTCVKIFGSTSLCLSTCTADADCNGQTCQDIGAFGYSLGHVCGCGADTDCGAAGLTCCTIPYVGLKTCMTSCPGG